MRRGQQLDVVGAVPDRANVIQRISKPARQLTRGAALVYAAWQQFDAAVIARGGQMIADAAIDLLGELAAQVREPSSEALESVSP